MSSTIVRGPDFTTVTERPGGRATQEQLSMLYTRYHFAASFCQGKDVLEVGCGAGLGLGYLERFAHRVTGVDIDERNLEAATRHYANRQNIQFRQMDAHELEFESQSMDVVILFEAVYYLRHPELFVAECCRILRPSGTLLISSVNPEWGDFNPSPFSVRYFKACELSALLEQYGFRVQLYGAFATQSSSLKSKGISILKRAARNLRLIPRTMKGKEFLKRLFFGTLATLPPEVDDEIAPYTPPSPIQSDAPVPVRQYKVLYAVGQIESASMEGKNKG
ncbi:MAG: class I SAM-dependent methyltransferase [Candidatus Omnitrophica bacterium]|nr:class I SAM-dependent methyltransferase [Candidatus Omnitrophota bacterium]